MRLQGLHCTALMPGCSHCTALVPGCSKCAVAAYTKVRLMAWVTHTWLDRAPCIIIFCAFKLLLLPLQKQWLLNPLPTHTQTRKRTQAEKPADARRRLLEGAKGDGGSLDFLSGRGKEELGKVLADFKDTAYVQPSNFRCGECDKTKGYRLNPLLGRCGE